MHLLARDVPCVKQVQSRLEARPTSAAASATLVLCCKSEQCRKAKRSKGYNRGRGIAQEVCMAYLQGGSIFSGVFRLACLDDVRMFQDRASECFEGITAECRVLVWVDILGSNKGLCVGDVQAALESRRQDYPKIHVLLTGEARDTWKRIIRVVTILLLFILPRLCVTYCLTRIVLSVEPQEQVLSALCTTHVKISPSPTTLCLIRKTLGTASSSTATPLRETRGATFAAVHEQLNAPQKIDNGKIVHDARSAQVADPGARLGDQPRWPTLGLA